MDTKCGKNCIASTSKEIVVEVEHVKAHRTEKDKKKMSHVVKYVLLIAMRKRTH